jgi:single-stranded-DNA-specific exonuclease
VGALTRCAATLEKFGGHEMAAGLALHEENFPKFAEAFCAIARQLLSEETLQRSLRLDHELPFTNIDIEFLRSHELLQPFGSGNPQPVFFARAVEPVGAPRISKEKHLVFRLRQGERHRRAVYFDGASTEFPPPPWDVAFRLGADEYGGDTLVGMRIEALRAAEKC